MCNSDEVLMAADEQVGVLMGTEAALEATTSDGVLEHELLMRSSSEIKRCGCDSLFVSLSAIGYFIHAVSCGKNSRLHVLLMAGEW